jgi:hypothetical protein
MFGLAHLVSTCDERRTHALMRSGLMAEGRTRLTAAAVGVVGMLLAFALVYSLCSYSDELKEAEDHEPPLSPQHEETYHFGHNIPPEEQQSVSERNTEPEAPPAYGELKWEPRAVKKEKPKETASSYEKEQEVVQPKTRDGGGAN